jgi:hypothetical protein
VDMPITDDRAQAVDDLMMQRHAIASSVPGSGTVVKLSSHFFPPGPGTIRRGFVDLADVTRARPQTPAQRVGPGSSRSPHLGFA